MANIMSLKSLRNKTSRNGFDLSTKRNFTAKAGELLPIWCKEVLPGDSFKINLKSFTRTQPINTAAFARMREYYDFFFVPYDLLWNKANTALTQMYDNPQHAVSLDSTKPFALNGDMPYTDCKSIADYVSKMSADVEQYYGRNYFGYGRVDGTVKLLEYLGYGNFSSFVKSSWSESPLMANLELNLFGLLGYQKIYADYYRDSQWEKISPSTFNVDYLAGDNMKVDFSDATLSSFRENYNFFDLRYCNWQKDLFHGVVPRQQYGDTAVVQTSETSEGNPTDFSILALRQAEFLQKWKEITQSGSKDYKDQIEKHWGVSAADGFSELSTYLGGIASSLDINEVVNSNITESFAADIAGKGTGTSNGYIDFQAGARYGMLFCIYHCLPLLDYTSDFVNNSFMRINAADYAIPEFDRVGMEAVPLFKMFNPAVLGNSQYASKIIGYAPRYIDYKTDVDISMGAFKTTLKNWVISYGNQSILDQLGYEDFSVETPDFPVNYTMFKVNPNCLDTLFAVNVDSSINTDQFLCSTFFDVKAVRNLDTDGLPY
ncbi:major capsid protein [Bacteroides stercoris]|uniref:Capsid protein (F protein) n=1 Tax=Bacteroides stercoris TaxID=46506 RepID=A0A120A1C9_BACSE|nr:major capsid protein [Bacteroides stercoris]KWR53414.1 capsid protein (F protein) [Bacteroides stercoris]